MVRRRSSHFGSRGGPDSPGWTTRLARLASPSWRAVAPHHGAHKSSCGIAADWPIVSPQADVSAPEIKDAYDAVRSDKDDKTWLLLDYAGDRSDKLVLTATGTGGLDELMGQLKEGNASFAYVRVKYANDVESTREKFILVTWIGKDVRVLRKAKLSVHAADVKRVISVFSLEVPANSLDDLAEVRSPSALHVMLLCADESTAPRNRLSSGCARREERATTAHRGASLSVFLLPLSHLPTRQDRTASRGTARCWRGRARQPRAALGPAIATRLLALRFVRTLRSGSVLTAVTSTKRNACSRPLVSDPDPDRFPSIASRQRPFVRRA